MTDAEIHALDQLWQAKKCAVIAFVALDPAAGDPAALALLAVMDAADRAVKLIRRREAELAAVGR